jgi:ApaG protein
MQSLSLSSTKSLAGLRLMGHEARVKRRGGNSNSNSMVVACSNNSDKDTAPSSTSFLSRTQTYALLKQQMEVAAKSEVSVVFIIFNCRISNWNGR